MPKLKDKPAFVTIICKDENCKKEFTVRYRYRYQKYCCRECKKKNKMHWKWTEEQKAARRLKYQLEGNPRIGRKLSKESRNKISKTRKERYKTGEIVSWNKGLTKFDCESIRLSSIKQSLTMKAKFDSGELVNWNAGKTKETDSRLIEFGRRISEVKQKQIANGTFVCGMLGKHFSDESKYKLSQSIKKFYLNGGVNSMQDKKHTEKTKQKMKDNWLSEKRKKYLNNFLGSKLEIEFEKILIDLNINYIKSIFICRKQYDFYLPEQKVLIEIDGDWWHCNPAVHPIPISEIQIKNIENDKIKNEIAIKYDYKLLRFWEWDIKNNIEKVKNKLECYTSRD